MPTNTPKPLRAPAPLLHHALFYSLYGWHVFPIKDRAPCYGEETTGRRYGASNDPAIIEQMFKERRDANGIGILTGAISGIWVLDLDNKNGNDGEASLRALPTFSLPLPLTGMAQTPNDGVHIYYATPDRKVYRSVSKVGPGIDVIGDGWYVIAPHGLGRRWIAGPEHIERAPSWMEDLVCRPVREPKVRVPQVLPAEIHAMMICDAGKGLSEDPADMTLPDDTDLKIWCALQVIHPDLGYDDWWHIGCGIYSALGDEGFTHFNEWSVTGQKYPGDRAMERKWRECAKVTAYSANTVYYHADQHDKRWRDAYRVMYAREQADASTNQEAG